MYKKYMDEPSSSIGKYMVGVGAGLVDKAKKSVLMLHRKSEFQDGVWEIVYGRLNQGESFLDALTRELKEETGIQTVTIIHPTRTWHLYRGPTRPEYELVGVTYLCESNTQSIRLSDEHDAYTWMTKKDVLACRTNDSIREDVLYLLDQI